MYEIPPKIEPAAMIVVLGGGIRNGELSNESMRRAVWGITLYAKRLAPLIVFSGPGQDPRMPSEGQVRAQLARDLGIPPEAIVIVDDAQTTRQESLRVGDLLGRQGDKRILLVTDPLHMRRARYVFERAGYQVLSAPSEGSAEAAIAPTARVRLAVRLGLETAALAYYKIAGYL
jgi:uncharacterized SAM-binding protein YcdF (DUF218 family)